VQCLSLRYLKGSFKKKSLLYIFQLAEWTSSLADVRLKLEPMLEDLKSRNEPIPNIESKENETSETSEGSQEYVRTS